MLFIEYPKCSTCQRAKKWLEQNEIPYTDRHIQEENPTYEELREWLDKSGLPLRKFFNTSGMLYKSMQLKDKLPGMSEEEQLRLLASDGMLVKRPIAVKGDTVLVGFTSDEWERLKGWRSTSSGNRPKGDSMNISNKMIHPEIRTIGKIIRFIIPYFKTSTFKLSRHIIGVLKKKSCKDMCYEQIYIPRKERRVTEDLLRICVYSPFERKKKATGILWIHGGGYGLGVPEQDEAFIRRFVLTYNCVVVSPDYCLSTIAPYPAALEDCYTALMWLKENAALYDICPNQLMVGGDSAGGGLTAALTIYARDKREVAIAFQMPLYPMLDDRMITKSSQNNDAPVWNTKSNENAWKLYLGSLYGTEDISPMQPRRD